METDAQAIRSHVEVSSEFDPAEWRRFVESAPGSTSAHLIEWRDLISATFGYEPVYRVARRDGQICGVLPAFVVRSKLLGRHVISVPFLNSGGIVAADDDVRLAILDDVRSFVRLSRIKHFEMRCAQPPPEGIPAREHKVRIVLDLPQNADQLWTSLRGEIRNRTRRAEKAGLRVEFGSNEIDSFYQVFVENMRDLGVPAHPRRFFEAVLKCFGAGERHSEEERRGICFSDGSSAAEKRISREARNDNTSEPVEGCQVALAVVKDGSEVIGGAILIERGDTVEVPWISCLRARFEQCPNNILYWELMRRACERGFRTFDFGRSTPNTGPAVFKMRWGAREEQLYWHYILPDGAALPAETGVSNPKFQLASSIWKRVPRAVTDFLGPKLIAHLPG